MKKEKDYRYAREGYIYYSLPATIFIILLNVPIDFKNQIEWEYLLAISSELAFGLFFTAYSLYYRKKRSKILNSEQFYEGKIVKCDAVYRTKGIGTRFYLYIEFQKSGIKEIMMTSGYYENPEKILGSLKCIVYEINGKYYPAQFAIAGKKQPKIEVPSFNIIDALDSKGRKEAEKNRRKWNSTRW